MLAREMEKLVEEEAPGPHPSFTLGHGLYALFLIAESSVGRQKLASIMSIGEGSARTLLRKLTKRGLVVADRSGCRLTPRGASVYGEAKRAFYLFRPKHGSLPGKVSFGVGLRGGGGKAEGVQERDQAVKAGAEGAITLVYSEGKLYMPGLSNVSEEHPDLAESILNVVSPSDGDAIIVSWGSEVSEVVYGSLSAAWSLYERPSSEG
ncbi:MAG: DUF4443 domain-containing protein [Conexivisphaerales archaeon]